MQRKELKSRFLGTILGTYGAGYGHLAHRGCILSFRHLLFRFLRRISGLESICPGLLGSSKARRASLWPF